MNRRRGAPPRRRHRDRPLRGSGRAGGPEQGRVRSGSRGGWRAWLITVGVLMVVWIMLWGSVEPSLLLIGFISAVVVLWLFPLPHLEFAFGLHPWRSLLLVIHFLWDVVVSSLHVAWLAVRPAPPRSAVMQVRLRNDSDLLQHLTALAVSLVPGSLIIDADPEERTLRIHLLDNDYDTADQMEQQVLAQEERIRAALGAPGGLRQPDPADGEGDRP